MSDQITSVDVPDSKDDVSPSIKPYIAGTLVPVEEDRAHEFKACTQCSDIVSRIKQYIPVCFYSVMSCLIIISFLVLNRNTQMRS